MRKGAALLLAGFLTVQGPFGFVMAESEFKGSPGEEEGEGSTLFTPSGEQKPVLDAEAIRSLIVSGELTGEQALYLADTLEAFSDIVCDPSFQELFDNLEVQELAAELLREGGRMAVEEPELFCKVLIALGVKEDYANAVRLLFEKEAVREILNSCIEQGTFAELGDRLEEYILSGKAAALLDEIAQIADEQANVIHEVQKEVRGETPASPKEQP